MNDLKSLIKHPFDWQNMTTICVGFFDGTDPYNKSTPFECYYVRKFGRDSYVIDFYDEIDKPKSIFECLGEINKLDIPYTLDINFGTNDWLSYHWDKLILAVFDDGKVQYHETCHILSDHELCEDFPLLKKTIDIARVYNVI